MKILVACEFSGVVRDAFAAKGHDAWSCDLLPSDRPGNHIKGDVLDHLHDGWDMMLAFPPCTYLCKGGLANRTRRPHLNWQQNQNTAFSFVWDLYVAPIEKICIENPIGRLNTLLRKPDQIIYANYFGHPYSKDICLWLKNLPRLKFVLLPSLFETVTAYAGKTKRFDLPSKKRNPGGRSIKSITFENVARAMADQWG